MASMTFKQTCKTGLENCSTHFSRRRNHCPGDHGTRGISTLDGLSVLKQGVKGLDSSMIVGYTGHLHGQFPNSVNALITDKDI